MYVGHDFYFSKLCERSFVNYQFLIVSSLLLDIIIVNVVGNQLLVTC